jgi:hypothetical protein
MLHEIGLQIPDEVGLILFLGKQMSYLILGHNLKSSTRLFPA